VTSLLPLLVCAVAVTAQLRLELRGAAAGAGVAKLIAAATFIWAALSFGALESGYGQWILAGLGCSLLGDALLIPEGRGTAFLLGIGAFLLGHVAYGVAFAGLGQSVAALVVAAAVVSILAIVVLRWLHPHVPADLRVPVLAYVVVISAMVALSVGAAVAGAFVGVTIGAIAFAVSDVSVARDRFVAPGFGNSAWGLPLYFLSQHVLAMTVRHLPI